jgi:hypothetical protein
MIAGSTAQHKESENGGSCKTSNHGRRSSKKKGRLGGCGGLEPYEAFISPKAATSVDSSFFNMVVVLSALRRNV